MKRITPLGIEVGTTPPRFPRPSKYDWAPVFHEVEQGRVVYITVPKKADPLSFRQLCYQRGLSRGLVVTTVLLDHDRKVAVWKRDVTPATCPRCGFRLAESQSNTGLSTGQQASPVALMES